MPSVPIRPALVAVALLAPSGAWAGADPELPTVVGECAKTLITEIGGRLSGDMDFETGTAVGYANGGWQVSYDREEGIVGSRVGDPVRLCLVSLPQDCPPGDDRGKVYDATNLRTGATWRLPDSQHMCGGA